MTAPQASSSSSSPAQRHLTIVIKLGTSSIVSESTLQPQLSVLSYIAETICLLRAAGHRVVLVSSGAIGMGLKRMGMSKKPKALADKQALAAIGQGRLIALYDNLFTQLGQPISQILLTRMDIAERSRYLNATKTLSSLLAMGVVPIVNENDTIAVQEIKFGDNDTLSAITAGMVKADYLFLLTDVDCLYTDNPRKSPDARPVTVVRSIEAVRKMVSTSTLGSSLGTGGMETKIIAAELATGAGVATIISHSAKPHHILQIISQPLPPATPNSEDLELGTLSNPPTHTIFLPDSPMPDRRWWILHGLAPRGRIVIDNGAYRAIFRHTSNEGNGGRLLAAGIVSVEGNFAAGQAVRIAVRKLESGSAESSVGDLRALEEEGVEVDVGRGLANYNWQEIDRIKGLNSSEVEQVLGYVESEHVVEAISGTRTLDDIAALQ